MSLWDKSGSYLHQIFRDRIWRDNTMGLFVDSDSSFQIVSNVLIRNDFGIVMESESENTVAFIAWNIVLLDYSITSMYLAHSVSNT